MSNHKCPKCGADMQEGFALRLPVRWIVGKPEKSFLGEIKAAGREQRHIESYRCVGCGYLESYATESIN